jgi:hypothetical protein
MSGLVSRHCWQDGARSQAPTGTQGGNEGMRDRDGVHTGCWREKGHRPASPVNVPGSIPGRETDIGPPYILFCYVLIVIVLCMLICMYSQKYDTGHAVS